MSTEEVRGPARTPPISVQERQHHFQRTDVRGYILLQLFEGHTVWHFSHCFLTLTVPLSVSLSFSPSLSISPTLSLSLCLLVLGTCPPFLPVDFLSASALGAAQSYCEKTQISDL